MADEPKPTSTKPQSFCDATWSPVSYGWQPSVLYNQHFGLPPLLDSRDLSWMENLFRKLGSSSWRGYTRASRVMSIKVHRELSEGVSEVYTEQCKWTVSLDVNHFAPTELIVRTQTGFLVIEGKHEERQDEHGYISRCFTRKYKLPSGVDVETMQSFLTGDGILTVEAKLTSVPQPADITIPVQVEAPTVEGKQEDDLQGEETAEGEGIPPSERDDSQPTVPPGAETKPEDESEAQQPESDDRLHPTAPTVEGEEEPTPSTAEEGQPEEKAQKELMPEEEQVEVSEEKVEDAGEAPEEVQEPAEQPEAAQAPDTVTSQLEEKAEAVSDGDVQEPEGEGEVQLAEAEIEQPATGQTQEEIPSQLEVQPEVVPEEMMQTKSQAK
ncbi:heat shock protein 67B1 [Colossoma macropomum]|uniref:heat shock protein 67B1 n=1 Tax=Colossoma macropomum TaxID=42526 RepID=UPI001864C477|nr:heat shock protein 67B1 [Colossoma macropomum]